MSDAARTLTTSLALRSRVTPERLVEVSLDEVEVPEPGSDQVVVRVEAAAINPSDVGMLFAGADLDRADTREVDGRPTLTAPLSEMAARAAASRVGRSLPVGNEGAGTVIAAGASDEAQALLGKVVGVIGGGMYGKLRCLDVSSCLALPGGTTAIEGAAWFINPMTALTMIATLHEEGHRAVVHTAAASSLGRMLLRLCLADGVPLINVVRRPEQAEELRELGAEHVCDSSSEGFHEQLIEAIAATGATIAFDAIGGGHLASGILDAMEQALTRGAPFDRYGSPVHKQVYLYGSLDRAPTELARSYGISWGVGGWLVSRRMERLGADAVAEMRTRVAAELRTTFATTFAARISLTQALDADTARTYSQAGTNGKHAINPAA
jgi:NADPH2:quinone reductase